MIVYYWLVDGLPPSGRNWQSRQIGRYVGPLDILTTDSGHLINGVNYRQVFAIDETDTPWRILRNDFGNPPDEKHIAVDGFWFFFQQEGHTFPQPLYPYINLAGDIIAADGTIIMRGPDKDTFATQNYP